MNKDLKQQIKSVCPFLHQSDITLILEFLDKKKPHLELLRDHKINTRTLTTLNQYFGFTTNNQSIQCLQMPVLDKKQGIKKVIEVFLVDQMQSEIEQFVLHVQLSKSLLRTDLVLQILDSYFLDDVDEDNQQHTYDENLYYAIEYEYFDYSNRDMIDYLTQKQTFLFQIQNAQESQQRQQLDNYLYNTFKYCEQILCPQRKRRDIVQADIRNLAYITFKQEANQPQIMKLNPIDYYLFENEFNLCTISNKQNQSKQQWPTRYIQSDLDIEIRQENFLEEFHNQFPKLFEQYSEVLKQIITTNSQYVIFKPTTFCEKENILTIEATYQNQHTSFKIQKYISIEEAQAVSYKINQHQIHLNTLQIHSRIKKQIIVSNQQGVFIIQEVDLSIFNQTKKLLEIKQDNLQIDTNLDDQQIFLNGLQSLETYTKLLLWLINNFQGLLQLQVRPESIFISQDGLIYENFNNLCYSSISLQSQNKNLIKRYTQIALDIFNLQFFWQMFDHNFYIQSSKINSKAETLIKNFFQSIDFSDEIWNQAAQQELKNFLNQLLKQKIINEKFEQILFKISRQSLDKFYFQQNFWIYYQDSIQILKENKNISEIRNILYFNKLCIPSPLNNLFKQQYYQITNQNNLNSQQKLIEFGQLIEQCLMVKQNLTDKQLNKIKLLSLQDLDKVYDLNNLQLKPFDNNLENLQCNCCKYENRLGFFELLKIVSKFYILVVIQDELKLENDELQQKCLVQQIIEHQNFLVKDQHSLQKITYELYDCQLLKQELKKNADFFDLKNKKNLVHFTIQLNEIQLKDFYKQLKQNIHKINTLNVFIRSNNPFENNQVDKNIFKKISTLVQFC